MPVNDWYPFNTVEWRRDTYHLNVAQRGIYRELIDEYMLSGQPLPDQDASLAGIARATAAEWAAHSEVIRAFFKARDGKLYHKRCERELDAQRMRAAKRSQDAKVAATLRWAKEKKLQPDRYDPHSGRNARAMRPDATLHNNLSTLTPTVVGETALTPARRAEIEMIAELVGAPKASDGSLRASPELQRKLGGRGS